MKITPKIVADAIRELNDTLQQDDPGCSCHKCAPCSRCTEMRDAHGNNLYEIPVAGARYFFCLGESFLYLTFVWDASVGLRYVETTNEEQSESELVHSLATMPKGTRRRFEDAIYYELNKTPKINGTTPDFIVADDIHDDHIDAMPGGIIMFSNDGPSIVNIDEKHTIIYNLDKNKDLERTVKTGDIVQFQNERWRVVDKLWLAKYVKRNTQFGSIDYRLCCHDNGTYIVRPDDYDRIMLVDAVSTIAKIVPNEPTDQRPIDPKHSRHGHALSLAVGRLGRTPDLHTELRKGVDPYSRD